MNEDTLGSWVSAIWDEISQQKNENVIRNAEKRVKKKYLEVLDLRKGIKDSDISSFLNMQLFLLGLHLMVYSHELTTRSFLKKSFVDYDSIDEYLDKYTDRLYKRVFPKS